MVKSLTSLNLGLLICEEDSNSWSHRVVVSMKSNSLSYTWIFHQLCLALCQWNSIQMVNHRVSGLRISKTCRTVIITCFGFLHEWTLCWSMRIYSQGLKELISLERPGKDSCRECQVVRMVQTSALWLQSFTCVVSMGDGRWKKASCPGRWSLASPIMRAGTGTVTSCWGVHRWTC